MFTGIITDIGTITRMHPHQGGASLTIACHYSMDDVALGASIACNGICLTVTRKGAQSFDAEASPETLAVTTLKHWQEGDAVNLERALRLGDELGGHLVCGHVDTTSIIKDIHAEGDYHRITLQLPDDIAPLVVRKGSLAVDGISLTVNAVEEGCCQLMIIPHSWHHTTLSQRQVGDAVNLEADMMARHIQRLMGTQRT